METCEICASEKKLATLKPCNHKACTECYFKLMKHFKVCPFCKTKLTTGKLTDKTELYYTEITVEDLEKKIKEAIRNMKNEYDSDSD
jgi:hypothetical protein